MNKELKDKAIELNQWLLSQEVVIEYKKYEQLIKNNPELQLQERRLKDLQKEIVNRKHTDEDCDILIKEYEIKKEEFFNNPIINNYLLLKEDVNQLLQQVNSIINKEINEKNTI